MKTLHICNALCFRVLKERQEGGRPVVWNSLTHQEQKDFDSHAHVAAASAYAETQRGSWTRKLVRALPYIFTKKQRARWLATSPEAYCPACGKLRE
jgi:hypothetical protein